MGIPEIIREYEAARIGVGTDVDVCRQQRAIEVEQVIDHGIVGALEKRVSAVGYGFLQDADEPALIGVNDRVVGHQRIHDTDKCYR